MTYHHQLLKSILSLAVQRNKIHFCLSTFPQRVTSATELISVQWWHLAWEPPGSICAAQRADTGYGSAKVCYFNNRNQTLSFKRDVSSKCWREQLIFVSLKTHPLAIRPMKSNLFFFLKKSFDSCWLDEMHLPIF